MTYIEALNECDLDEDTIEELYTYIDALTNADEIHLLHWPHHIENLIKIIIKPDALSVVRTFGDTQEPFLDRVLVYKNRIQQRLSIGYPNEYTFLRRFLGNVY